MTDEKAYLIKVEGLVQGVGFRPFVYRLARHHGIGGWVENRNDGVLIRVQGHPVSLESFVTALQREAPPASSILSLNITEDKADHAHGFFIRKSENTSDEITEISPDIAVCEDCLLDMKVQPDRLDYPFINCTNCGPRFTIIRDLPYDRDKTTMEPFTMCEHCSKEYSDIMDRRFHAQPVACTVCGPHYELRMQSRTERGIHRILTRVCRLLEQGGIIAMKGLGGFHMACDAANEKAVSRLREMKNRDGKPFAVMFRSLGDLREYAFTGTEEESLLQSWKRPIVILKEKRKLAHSVSNGFATVGAMLPYMPFHYLLFEHLRLPVIVLTSGNISDEPIVTDDDEAVTKLAPISDALLVYNRKIFNRTDDSVVMVVNNRERLIRRSRGYVPAPVRMNLDVDGILAAGAELVNCHCVGKGTQAFLSQHIGDLKNLETLDFYAESIAHFTKLFRITPSLVAADMHPDYLSTRYTAELGLPVISVQHHHAHIASCMAEHGLDEQVIGVALDGTGLGDDGCIWGGEFMLCDLAGYQRVMHFAYVPMPGGDKAIEEPWRMALSWLYKTFGSAVLDMKLPFLSGIDKKDVMTVLQMIDKKINSPMTSSTGRLFDAVSALLNLCTHAAFHAEAPMRLEDIMDHDSESGYPFVMDTAIHFEEMFKAIVRDMKEGIRPSVIAARFHHTIINIILAAVQATAERHQVNKVVLSGGSFQNRVLLGKVEERLSRNGFDVRTHSRVPSNDGGIALGQLAVAAKKRSLSCV